MPDIFPKVEISDTEAVSDLPEVNASFLTERSQSLWSQLVAPPPLQPPNWVRSRIRRLFLVSLGVPVDLDEIFPASKQKKLVLPSVDVERRGSSKDGERSSQDDALSGVKGGRGTSSRSERKRRGQPSAPEFNSNVARLFCSRTTEALGNLTDEELRDHATELENLKLQAGKALEYWLLQRDSAAGDKEAYEEVIENLVKHAKKIRK